MTTIASSDRTVRNVGEAEYLAQSAKVFRRQSVGMAILLVIVACASQFDLSRSEILVYNSAVLIGFVILSSVSAYALIRYDAYNVWSPATLFLLSSALFFGFGPLAYSFGSEGTKTYLALRPPAADAFQLNRSTVLSMAGLLGTFVGMAAMFSINSEKVITRFKGEKRIIFSPALLAAVFTIVGLMFKYLIYFPSIWGLTDVTIPGVLTQINALAAIGFGLWTYVAVRRGPVAVVILLIFWSIDLGLTTLAFSKRWLVLAMVFPMAGHYLARRSLPITLWFAAIILTVYVLAQPMVTFARLAGGSDDSALGFGKRAEIVAEYVIERPDVGQRNIYDGSQRWWTRFDSSGRQAFAMQLRDNGERNYSFDTLPIIFIPRVIWPEKPIIEPPGKRFYSLVTGRTNNNMPVSVYGDVYWHFGWLGIALVMPLIGMVLALMVKLIMPEVRRENFVYFPAVLIGMQLALTGANGFLINGYLTAIPLFILYLYVIKQADNLTNHAALQLSRPATA